ncbi:hypothetical protein A3I25_00850 [Candidatus Nomurabacteria bacterium RIFCSPLOWO2_02_FULL_42_17]|uniref:FAD/NAD(P)-binding domain-containing protein n=2 Tax=Candidatus Nomuraibacteriota TaxID=1752729 RepID=A0A1F6WJT3_9BACT|nr:MAG: Alkyl hydroperoxide reductase [Parcubacteria group bacterium GW2011_GWA2_42_18]OGI82056.1 MAG: hypothetical protein A3B93_02465 [Candidatus Nomurabacteria bacterium RIFCSPHIGHO2_02_FULL_42_24]OGI96457.1 MAG: hypothetical protein A3I25_00850 [Candidatus Nomurabacteria bacterium RIFCSPLOWO2_02_FULL_42_17]
MIYDLIIIGGGPAGVSGGVYAARKQLKTLLIAYEFGGQSFVSPKIENWIGTPAISGQELADNLKKHVEAYKGEFLEIKEGEKVMAVEKSENGFKVKTESRVEYETKTILLTAGSVRRKLEVPGADKFENKGITYCASCDGPMFAGQDVAVVGGGNAAFETAAQLLSYCKSVTLLNRSDRYRADELTVKKVLANPKMRGLLNAELQEIKGDKFVSGLTYRDKVSGKIEEIKVIGVFSEIGQISNTSMVKGLVEMNEYGQIKVNPRTQATSVPGVWAAGDCTDGLYHQNNISAGDAVKALEDLYLWLHAK